MPYKNPKGDPCTHIDENGPIFKKKKKPQQPQQNRNKPKKFAVGGLG
jgi:hypothetical protein